MPSRTQSRTRRAPRQETNEESAVIVFTPEVRKKKAEDLVSALAARQDQIIAFLGSDQKTSERFLTVAIDSIVRDPNVLQADLLSLVASVRHAAIMGLEPSSVMGEGAIVVYRDNDQGGKKIAQFQPMVRGLQKLARNSGEIRSIGVDVVRKNDHFVYRSGSDPIIEHEPYIKGFTGDDDPGDVIGAYAFVKLASGELVPLFMSTAEINKRRQVSKSFQNSGERSIWGQWPEEMMKKTVLRRLLMERVPLSPRAQTALALDAEIDSKEGDPEKVEARAAIGNRTRDRLAAGIMGDLTPEGDADKPPESPENGSGPAEPPEAAPTADPPADGAQEPSTEGTTREICGKPGLQEGVFCTEPPKHNGTHRAETAEGDGVYEWL
jgi:recombination protein RecT